MSCGCDLMFDDAKLATVNHYSKLGSMILIDQSKKKTLTLIYLLFAMYIKADNSNITRSLKLLVSCFTFLSLCQNVAIPLCSKCRRIDIRTIVIGFSQYMTKTFSKLRNFSFHISVI